MTHVRDDDEDASGGGRLRDRISLARRETKTPLAMRGNERKSSRREVVLVFLLLSIASLSFLSGQCVEAFRAAGPGGRSKRKQTHERRQKQRKQQQQQQQQQSNALAFQTWAASGATTTTTTTTTTRLNVVPLKDKNAASNSNSNSNSKDDVKRDESATNVAANNSTAGGNGQFLINFNASASIGSLLMQMQKKEAELKQLNKSASLLLSEDQALKLDGDPAFYRSERATTVGMPGEATKAATKAATATATTASPKNDLFSWIRKTDGDARNGGADGDAPGANGDAAARTGMDEEIARELDASVSIRITNSLKDVALIGPPEIYRATPRTDDTARAPTQPGFGDEESTPETGGGGRDAGDGDNLPRLSRAEHYDGRIGRDMRHLAVSIASCIDSVEEWQLFCRQTTGGLEPLIECIREGARSIREGSSSSSSSSSSPNPRAVTGSTYKSGFSSREENFQAASSACRAIRDLCAISLDLASVITDGLLRANAAYKASGEHTLMDDLCTILRHDDELSDLHHQLTDKATPKRKRRRRLLSIRRRRNKKQEEQQERERERETTTPPPRAYDDESGSSKSSKWPMAIFRERREARLRWKLYVTQLLLAMTCASDCAVDAIRSTDGLRDVLLVYSSYARKERRRRWMRLPGEMIKSMWLETRTRTRRRRRRRKDSDSDSDSSFPDPREPAERRRSQPFIEAASLKDNLKGRIKGTANQVLAAIGYNEWVPKIPGQKGLRILCLDGGGSRGMTSVVAMKCLVDSLGGMEVADCFDLVVGTSTGAIIAFLVGLNRETSEQAVERYDVLIEKIFTKSAFSTPMLLFTTASYDESPFMNVLTDILKDNTMLDSRANPAVPLVFAVTSKMSSNPTHVALFRNYNYNGGELPDPFMINPNDARENLGLLLENEPRMIRMNDYPKKKEVLQSAPGTVTPDNGSRHPGSFRVLQKYALRASTAAPTVFKPVLMGGEMYCDGGIVASNPSAIAIHEARTIFPDVPIELVVSIGTGGFKEQKSEPRIGWDGIIGQIINSATDGEQIHHILEDVLGDGTTAQGKASVSNTCYMRFNPTLGMPDEFPIDVTDPGKLQQIKTITKAYMDEPEQQQKLQALSDILKGRGTNRLQK